LDPILPFGGVAGLDEVTRLPDQRAACGTRRLDGRLDDRAPELINVVGRAEDVTEAGDRISQPLALGGELVEARLQLSCHLVERAAEERELVTPLQRTTLEAIADGDRESGIVDAEDPAIVP